MTNDSTELFTVLGAVLQHPADMPLTWDSDLYQLGLDSLSTVEVTLQIEERYNIMLPDRALVPTTFATPAHLWAEVQRAVVEQTGAGQ